MSSGLAVALTAVLMLFPTAGTDPVDLIALIQAARESETRQAAIDELIAVSKDTTIPLPDRKNAIRALGTLQASSAKGYLEEIATISQDDACAESEMAETAAVAYWRVVVAEIASPDERKTLLVRLLRGENPEPKGRWVSDMARDELANYGYADLLPEMLDEIKGKWGPGNEYGEDLQWVTREKIEILNIHNTRIAALMAAMQVEDPTRLQLLRRWAVAGLAELGTQEALGLLIDDAKRLQAEHHDEYDRRIPVESSNPNFDPTMAYKYIIVTLREHGWTTEQLEAVGLFPDRYFWTTDEDPS